MHELALMQDLVASIDDELARPSDGTREAQRVAKVRLEIGELAAVVPDALRFAFDISTRGTSLEGAALEILPIEGRGRCRTCQQTVALHTMWGPCSCGSHNLEILSGLELRLKDVEVM